MRRTLFLVFAMTLVGSLFLSGCGSKKAASTPASVDQSASTDNSAASGAKETDVSTSGSAGKTADVSSLPVVYFGFNEATVRAEDRDKLKLAADALKASKAKITIEGHCDERGSTEYNLALGERRAQSVKSYLSKLGVPSANLATISYGEERPAVEGHNEDAWAKDRRGELIVNK